MVVREGALVAVFPVERAIFQAAASQASLRDLFGLALSPSEIMDVLVGAPPSRLRSCRVRWGPTLPRAVDAELADGTRLSLRVDSAEPDVAIPPAAFRPPPSDGFRAIDATEARTLWSR